MNSTLHSVRLIAALVGFSLVTSLARAEPESPQWKTLRQESHFKELKTGDKVAFVCNGCKTISPLPIESSEQGPKLAKVGESVTCPNCQLITKVIVRASRKDLYAPPIVTYINEKGEEMAFMVTTADIK